MDLRFVPRDLKRLDQISSEVLVAPVVQDERPPTGVAGLVDWRLSGQVSRVVKSGFFLGELCETLLLPSRAVLPFDKTLVFGCGPKASFDERTFLTALDGIRSVLKGLKAVHAVVELPGRHLDLISAERAVDLLLERAQGDGDSSTWTLVDTPQAQQTLTDRRLRERRQLVP